MISNLKRVIFISWIIAPMSRYDLLINLHISFVINCVLCCPKVLFHKLNFCRSKISLKSKCPYFIFSITIDCSFWNRLNLKIFKIHLILFAFIYIIPFPTHFYLFIIDDVFIKIYDYKSKNKKRKGRSI